MVAPSLDENVGTPTGPVSRSASTASVIQIPTTTTPIIPKKNHETSTVGTVQVADRPC